MSDRSAAFRIKKGGTLDIKHSKLKGFSGVLDADQIQDVRTDGLEADASSTEQTPRWWTHPVTIVTGTIIATVAAGVVLHFLGLGP